MASIKGILDQIGNTPLVEASHLISKKGVKLYLKLEGDNPGGSVKDRAAFNMISEALKRGDIKKGGYLVEATSGNTGIALAMVAKQFGIQIELVMPENSTKERIQTMEAYKRAIKPESKMILSSDSEFLKYFK